MKSNDKLEKFLEVKPIDPKKTIPPFLGQGRNPSVIKREIGRMANLGLWLIVCASGVFIAIAAWQIYLTEQVLKAIPK